MTPTDLARERLPGAKMSIDQIPREILDSDRGVCWNFEERGGKQTKVPYIATELRRHAKSNDPTTWRPFRLAVDAVQDGKADGAGYVLGDGNAGVDLDDCRDKAAGAIAEWAQQIIDSFSSYTEVSPSGKGVKIFLRVDPILRLRGGKHTRPDGSVIELFSTGKYFTVTGQHVPGTPTTIADRTTRYAALHQELFSAPDGHNGHTRPAPHIVDDDQELVARASRAANGTKFSALWSGDVNGYGSHSEADLALCNLLAFWAAGDGAQIDRFFRQSGLMRHKWDTRRGESTYGAQTIQRAIAGCSETYQQRRPSIAPADRATSKPFPETGAEIGVRLEDFHAYMPTHSYIFAPSGDLWPAASVNARIPPVVLLDEHGHPQAGNGAVKRIKATAWLDQHRPVEQMTWAPGLPPVVRDRLVSEGGWIDRRGCATFNLYRPPSIELGDAQQAGRWLEHLERVYADDAGHIIAWLAHRVQRPDEKVNHALVLGGLQGIGKDTVLEPIKHAVGPWNFAEVTPGHVLGRFNGFVRSVILRVSEARDLGDVDRFAFYDHLKIYTAAPPDVLRVDEKNLREYPVWNVTGVVITTNYKTDGLFLPADDRRHYVAWSDRTKDDFSEHYWCDLWRWYRDGGIRHVAAYLAAYDLARFDAKAPPRKAAAFWDVVDANRVPEDAELADVLDKLEHPLAVTLAEIAERAPAGFADWLRDRKSARQVPHRMESAGYLPVRNESAKDGLWRIDERRQVVYARQALSVRDRLAAAAALGSDR